MNKESNVPEKKGLSSLTNAIRLLKTFSHDEYEIGITDLAKHLGLAKSTVHRMASTLEMEGLLEKNPQNDKYRLGIALFHFGALVRQRMNVSNEARPFLMALREKANETVLLAIPDRDEIMYVFHLESNQAIRMRSDIGVRKPMVCTAEGQSMLAFQSDDEIKRVLSRPIKARTPHTVTDPSKLREKLRQIAEQGYAIDNQENEIGMLCIAAPVRDAEGKVVASVGLAGPKQRMTEVAINKHLSKVLETAALISHRLGY